MSARARTRTHTRTHTHTHKCAFAHTHTLIRAATHIHIHQTHTHRWVKIRIMCMHWGIHACMYARMHTCIHTTATSCMSYRTYRNWSPPPLFCPPPDIYATYMYIFIECFEIQVIFGKRATNGKALLRKMTCKDTDINATHQHFSWSQWRWWFWSLLCRRFVP